MPRHSRPPPVARAAIAGTAIYFVLVAMDVGRGIATWTGMTIVIVVRLASIIWGLQLPVFTLEGGEASRDRTS